jgi:hypothetical protein
MRRITGLAMATLMVLGVSACGSDDDTSSSDTTVASADGGDTTTTAASDDGGDGSTDGAAALGLIDEDCQFLLAGAYLNPLVQAMSGAGSDYDEVSDQLQAVAEKAPEEIQDAMDTISEGYAELAEALQDVDLTDVQSLQDPDVQEAFQNLESVFDEEYEQATQAVGDYVNENCAG